MTISTIRHQEILNPTEYGAIPITVIGVGATGSHLAMSLVELGFTNITFYDDDVIEAHNLANQAYNANHIGVHKVTALRRLIKAKLGDVPSTMRFKKEKAYNHTPYRNGIVFLLTDSMESRRALYPMQNAGYVIETRMASTHGNVLGFYPSTDGDEWLKTLANDEDTELSACGSPISVGPTAKIIANLAVWHLINYLTCPEALDAQTNLFLKPLTIHSGDMEHVETEQAEQQAEVA